MCQTLRRKLITSAPVWHLSAKTLVSGENTMMPRTFSSCASRMFASRGPSCGLLQRVMPLRSMGVYHKIWDSTSNFEERRAFGSIMLWWKVMPYAPIVVLILPWFLFYWFSDDWKYIITLGMWQPALYHPDRNVLSPFRPPKSVEYLKPYD